MRTALQKLPADRFSSAAQFAEALAKPGLVTQPSLPGVATGAAPEAAGAGAAQLAAALRTLALASLSGLLETRPTVSLGERRQLFEGGFTTFPVYPNYDVTRDGRTFLLVRPVSQNQQFIVVLNWVSNLGRQAGATAPAIGERR